MMGIVLVFIFLSACVYASLHTIPIHKQSISERRTVCITGQLYRLELHSKFQNIIVPLLRRGYETKIIFALQQNGNNRVNPMYESKNSTIYDDFNNYNYKKKNKFWEDVIIKEMNEMGITKVKLTKSSNIHIKTAKSMFPVLQQEYELYYNMSFFKLSFYPHTYKWTPFDYLLHRDIIAAGDKFHSDENKRRMREFYHLVSLYECMMYFYFHSITINCL
jgi:hypothetical protein